MLTRKHFQAIAATIAAVRDTQPSEGRADSERAIDTVAFELSNVFAGLNGQFDRDRFLRACHVSLENVL